MLALLDFDKLFKMNCDALVWGLEVFLVKRGASWHFSMKSLLASKKLLQVSYRVLCYCLLIEALTTLPNAKGVHIYY